MGSRKVIKKKKRIEQIYLMTVCGVTLDSHKWFRIAPFHVALNRRSDSEASDSDENPADPTKIRCWI